MNQFSIVFQKDIKHNNSIAHNNQMMKKRKLEVEEYMRCNIKIIFR